MRSFIYASSCIVALTLAQRADACGSTPQLTEALLPVADATEVPLNAVLISSSNWTAPGMWLYQVNYTASSDAGVEDFLEPRTEVALEIECTSTLSGSVCIGRPKSQLEPNTRYVWSVALSDTELANHLEPPKERKFTTGSESDLEPLPEQAVELAVASDESFTSDPCGIERVVELDLVSRALAEPVVLHFADYTPSYVMRASLLMPETNPARTTLYNPPECLGPVAVDQVGRRVSLPTLCLNQASEPDQAPPDGGAPNDPTSGSKSESIGRNSIAADDEGNGSNEESCAVSTSTTSNSTFAVLALALFAVRRLLRLPCRRSEQPRAGA